MKNNDSTPDSENQKPSYDVYLRSHTDSSVENNDDIDMSRKKNSMLGVEDICHDFTDDKNSKTGDDDLIQNLLDDQPSYSPTDFLDTLNNEIALNDKTDIDGILSGVSSEEENANSVSPADITDSLNDGDDETDIDDIIQKILNDKDNENQPSLTDSTNTLNDDETDINDIIQNILNDANYKKQPSPADEPADEPADDPVDDPVDVIDTLNTVDEVNTNKIEDINDASEASLLKAILGEQYQDSQSIINNAHDIDLHDSSVYLSQAEDNANNQLDQKLVKLENLWDELASIWPAINDQPEKKIKIEELWRSLKKADDANDDIHINDISFNDSTYNDALIDVNHEEFETTLDEINHILGYDLNLDNPDIYPDTYNEKNYNEPAEESGTGSNEEASLLTISSYEPDYSINQTEPEMTDTYSVSQDDDTGLTGSPDVNVENSDISLVESILNETGKSDSDKLIDSILNEIPGSSIENTSVNEAIDSIYDSENILPVTDDLAPILSDHEDSSDNTQDLLSSINSEADLPQDETILEFTTREEALIEAGLETPLSEASLQTLENEDLLYYPAQASEYVTDPIDSTLKNKKTSIKDQPTVTRKPLENEKQNDKTIYSRMPTPDYRSTPGRSTTSVTDSAVKTSSLKTATNLSLAATLATVAFASWIYFSDDKLKTESINTDTIKDKRIISSPLHNQENISAQEPAKHSPDSSINDTDLSSQVSLQSSTDLRQADHVEVAPYEAEQMDSTYQAPSEYPPGSSISDTKTSPQNTYQDTYQDTATIQADLNEADNSLADPVKNPSEYDVVNDVVNDVVDNEITLQQGVYEPEKINNNAESTVADKNISDIGTSTFKPPEEHEPTDLYKTENQTVEPELISPISINEALPEQVKSYEWSLNLSSINRTREPAKDITDFLNNLSIPAEIKQVNIDGKIWFRIRIGGFTSKQNALSYMQTIRERTSIRKYWISKNALSDNKLD